MSYWDCVCEANDLSANQIFSRVRAHLKQMRRRAYEISVGTRYRTSDERQCAIGCLLTDKEAEYADRLVVPAARLLPRHAPLVTALQRLHDRHASWGASGLTPDALAELERIGLELAADE